MVIELSGIECNLVRMKIIARPKVQLPPYDINFEIAQFNSLNTRTTRFWSVPLYIEPVAGLSKSETRNVFTSASCQRDVIPSCDCVM